MESTINAVSETSFANDIIDLTIIEDIKSEAIKNTLIEINKDLLLTPSGHHSHGNHSNRS